MDENNHNSDTKCEQFDDSIRPLKTKSGKPLHGKRNRHAGEDGCDKGVVYADSKGHSSNTKPKDSKHGPSQPSGCGTGEDDSEAVTWPYNTRTYWTVLFLLTVLSLVTRLHNIEIPRHVW